MGKSKDRTGEIGVNKQGVKMWILKYNKANDIIVQFESGYVVKSKYINFMDGKIRDPYTISIYRHGYMGCGKYKTVHNGKHTKAYRVWASMLERCYSNSERLPSYEDCTVCVEWHNYQNFAKWFDDNYYKIEGERIELDKDILYDNNKIYSPFTCVFTPGDINLMFRKNKNLSKERLHFVSEKYKGLIPDILYNRLLELQKK